MRPVDPSKWRRFQPTGQLGFVVALLLSAGCQDPGKYGGRPYDPFLGTNAPPKPVAPVASGTASPQTAANTPPALPASISVPSQAAMASGTTPRPDNPRDLRISTPPVMPVSNSGTARGAAPSGVRVGEPVSIPSSTSRTLPTTVASSGGRPINSAAMPPPPQRGNRTLEQALQYLKKNKGTVWQRLDEDQGRWTFRCSLPNPGNATLNEVYETTKPLPSDPLSAVNAVIDSIEKAPRR